MAAAQRNRRANGRLAAILAVSVVVHVALFLGSRLLPHTPPPPKRERVTITIRDAEPPKPPPEPPPPPPKGPPTPPAPKPQIAKKLPLPVPAKPTPPVDEPPPPEPPKEEPPVAVNKVAPSAPPGPKAAPPGPDLGKVRLFDSNALGLSVQRSNPNLPPSDRFQNDGDDPDSAGAEAARVASRVNDQFAEAAAGANVSAGFISACDDGLDNNLDGEIDCADPGCRQLPLCAFTGVYEDEKPLTIPDGDGRLVRTFDVEQEGLVRKLALRIDVLHASPGDLAVTLVAPDGRRALLRSDDRGDHTWKKSFYVRPFIGRPAEGRWTLEIEDRHPGVRGVLRGWSMFLTS